MEPEVFPAIRGNMDAVEDIGDRESCGDRDDGAATAANHLPSQGIPDRLQTELHQTVLASAAKKSSNMLSKKKRNPKKKN